MPDAARYYAAIADLPWSVWLDSGGMARFDILTAAPQRVLDASNGDLFSAIRRELGVPVPSVADVPFAGGALGYWGYDLAHAHRAGDAAVGIYDWALVLDHREKTARLVSHRRYPETESLLLKVLQLLLAEAKPVVDRFRVQGKIACNFSRTSYAAAFGKVQGYLQAGDCYQVNLAQRFSATAGGNALGAYLKLRSLSPAPFSAFLNFPGVQVLCASPERFVSVFNGQVQTRPIKGTRPRDKDPLRDRQLAEELGCHPKDRAENLMIVDLLRNDLGKSCKPGSVRVPELFKVESYANVHHLVSTVQGELAEGVDALALLGGCFPGGSITGAPKVRAMQIIAELEPDPRGIYCGSIGYVGFDGNMDTNIVIRTLVYRGCDTLLAQPADCGNNRPPDIATIKDTGEPSGVRWGEISCWAGGGLVADSQVDAEYQETLDKASLMLELLQLYGGTSG